MDDIPKIAVDAYFDFRSPFAHMAHARIVSGAFEPSAPVRWIWRPVSIDVLLNRQAGREPWAPYIDPLAPPKRAHFLADVRRSSAFYGVRLRPPVPARQNSVPALWLALAAPDERRAAFIGRVFGALWEDQRDISDANVLRDCLVAADCDPDLAALATTDEARSAVAAASDTAYERGVFGVPSFVLDTEIYFGNDRLEFLDQQIRKTRL